MAEKPLGNVDRGTLFVLSAPAGTGKTTLVRMLCDEFPCVVRSVSCTTRAPRTGEVQGRDYWFLTPEQFQEKVEADEFLEHATVFGHCYGTTRTHVAQQQSKGRHVVLVIDTQGALQLQKQEGIDAVFIFVSPPNLQELRERLFKRKTETPELIEQRLSWAQREMALARFYDYHIVNQNLQVAYDVLRSIVVAEEHRTHKEER
jgi:guanylate kinase